MGVSLEKRAETAQVSLVKAMQKVAEEKGVDLGDVSAQVILVLDFSGSMSTRYNNKDQDGKSEMDLCAERVLGLSLSGLDADGKVPFYMFHDGVFPPDILEQANYLGFIDTWRAGPPFVIGPAPAAPAAAPTKKRWGWGKSASTAAAGPGQQTMYRSMGGTDYLPAIRKIIADCREQGLFEPGEPPVLVVFLTDGSTDIATQSMVEKELKAAADLPIFWQFIGLGYEPAFLKKLNKASGSRVDNVGLIVWNSNTAQMPDAEFYDALIKEFIGSWLPAAQAAGIVKWKAPEA